MIYVPNASEQTCLDLIRVNRLQGGTLRLFIANHVPVQGDAAATYAAIEASFGGYAAIVTNGWGAVFNNGSNVAETDEGLRTFTATGAGLPTTVYGVYFLDAAGLLVFAELDPGGGVLLSVAGDTYSYLPLFQLQTA